MRSCFHLSKRIVATSLLDTSAPKEGATLNAMGHDSGSNEGP